MDIKSRNTTKGHKNVLHTEKKKQPEGKYSDKEAKCINDLKKLYMDTINLDADLQREIYILERSYEHKHNEIYDKRSKMIENFNKQNQGGDEGEFGNISNFWLNVLKASYTEFISKKDEKILVYLDDIRSKLYNEPDFKFDIEFHFLPNEWFSNSVLTKTYFLNCLPDAEYPLSYDGAEIYKCEGCKINWKHPEKEKDKNTFTSFFDFFDPPVLPENPSDPTFADIKAFLRNDFELGFYLKERVIPKAVLFLTGEIADCLSSDSETDSEDNADDDDENDNGKVATAAAGRSVLLKSN